MIRRGRALVFLVAALAALGGGLAAAPAVPTALPTDDASVIHALNRLTFGLRPGDVDRVRQMGLPNWIDAQLRPSSATDAVVDARLAGFKTLSLDSDEVARDYVMPARAARRERQRAQAPADDPAAGAAPGRLARADAGAAGGERQVIMELASAKLLRAVYGERQIEEILADFWFNHFNVFAGKGRTSMYVTEYERDAIRPHVLGHFRDLLEATAKSPAMLFYLDNWMSADPDAPDLQNRVRAGGPNRRRAGIVPQPRRGTTQAQPRQAPAAGAKRQRGLNENYGRELLELHTLGVDGGYTQRDVTEVARAFTGWTIDPRTQAFRFVPALHDNRAKVVLGHTLKAGGGIEDGEHVLDIIASHPATARHIAMQLAQRFVSDEPPAALVDRAAASFLQTSGDLREVVRTIVTSPEFFSTETRAAKTKTPLEFLASALRATRADITDTRPLLRALQQLGMPLYMCQPPTGYDDTAAAWVSSGALVSRMNVALDLGNPRTRALSSPLTGAADVGALRSELIRDALGGAVSPSTRATIEQATTSQQTIALVLGSPEFQKR